MKCLYCGKDTLTLYFSARRASCCVECWPDGEPLPCEAADPIELIGHGNGFRESVVQLAPAGLEWIDNLGAEDDQA